MGKGSGFDQGFRRDMAPRLADTVDAMYCVDGTDEAWAHTVMARLHGDADFGLGLAVAWYDASDPARYFYSNVVSSVDACPDLRIMFTDEVRALIQPDWIRRAFALPVGPFTEIEGWKTQTPAELLVEARVGDIVGINGSPDEGTGCCVFVPSSRPARLSERHRRRLTGLSRHLGAADRLRRRLRNCGDALDSPKLAALLSSDGRVAHAGPAAGVPRNTDDPRRHRESGASSRSHRPSGQRQVPCRPGARGRRRGHGVRRDASHRTPSRAEDAAPRILEDRRGPIALSSGRLRGEPNRPRGDRSDRRRRRRRRRERVPRHGSPKRKHRRGSCAGWRRSARSRPHARDRGLRARRALAAHAASVIHRDIKPANLFLTHLGDVKVLDFGVARLLDESGITASGGLLGTPAFMHPEQALGERSLNHRVDVWAVGAVMFRLLSGRDVHPAPNEYQRLLRATTTPAEHLASVAPYVPRAVCEVVDRALAFDQNLRWDSARRMRSALRSAHAYDPLS